MMKQLLLIFSILIATYNHIDAQINPEIKVNNTLAKFEGIWLWVNGNDTVKLSLKKERVLLDSVNLFYADVIVGFHLYKQGTVIIESSYSHKDVIPSRSYRSFLGNNIDGGDVLEGRLVDLSKNKSQCLTLTLNSSHTSLIWLNKPCSGIQVLKIPGVTLPRDLVLIKQ